MATNSDSEASEEYEVLDLSNINENWLRQITKRTLGDISRQSAAKQFGVGSVTGVVAGWLFVKVGKVAAATLGTTVLLIQVAQHQGYIQINWDQVRSTVRRAEQEVHRTASRNLTLIVAQHQGYIQINWDQVRSTVRRAEQEVHRTASRHYPGLVRNMREFMQQNLFLAVGFGGGFLVGMAI